MSNGKGGNADKANAFLLALAMLLIGGVLGDLRAGSEISAFQTEVRQDLRSIRTEISGIKLTAQGDIKDGESLAQRITRLEVAVDELTKKVDRLLGGAVGP